MVSLCFARSKDNLNYARRPARRAAWSDFIWWDGVADKVGLYTIFQEFFKNDIILLHEFMLWRSLSCVFICNVSSSGFAAVLHPRLGHSRWGKKPKGSDLYWTRIRSHERSPLSPCMCARCVNVSPVRGGFDVSSCSQVCFQVIQR